MTLSPKDEGEVIHRRVKDLCTLLTDQVKVLLQGLEFIMQTGFTPDSAEGTCVIINALGTILQD